MKPFSKISFLLLVLGIILFSWQAQASYRSTLKQATQSGRIYDLNDGNAKIIFDATLFTDDFRRAFAEKDAEIHYLNAEGTAALIAREETKQAAVWEIFISLYTRKDYKKFSLTPDTFWESFITTASGENIWPVKIEKLKMTPYWKVMFPNITRWAQAYRVEFPKVPLGDEVSLTLQSVVGQKTVTWKLR